MKKLLLLSLLLLSLSPVFGQQRVFFTTGAVTTGCDAELSIWHCNASWVEANALYSGDPAAFDPGAFVTEHGTKAANSYPGVLSNPNENIGDNVAAGEEVPDIVVVQAGHSLYITNHILYSGYIIVEPGAKLIFNKPGGDKGRLEMRNVYKSMIELRGMPASDIISNATGSNGDASNYLLIGSGATQVKINGHLINTLPSPILATNGKIINIPIDRALLACLKDMESSIKHGHEWTQEEIVALLKCANPNFTLPVELLSYDARVGGHEVTVEWAAAKEWNFSHYVVEWSTDAENFYAAGSITARGTENGVQYYSFRHRPGQSGTLYYRLLGVDIDGTLAVKEIKVLRIGAEVFNVYAEQGRLHINYNGPADSRLVLMDTMGRVVSASNLSEEGMETLGLQAGIYLVQISNSLEKKTRRVIIR